MRSIASIVMILILVCTFSALAETVSVNSGQAVPASDHPSSYDGTPTIPHLNELDEAYVCLIKDVNGWSNANEEILISMAPEVTYDLITSSMIATTDFSDYTFVLTSSDQNAAYNQNLLDNMAILEGYVEGGGWLQFHMGTNTHTPHLTLWDGTTYVYEDNANENFMGPDGMDHPALEGVAEPYPGNFTNHGILVDYPVDAAVIVVTGAGNPTYVEFEYGNGNVVVTTMTMEHLWQYHNDTSGPILWNTINYMANRAPSGPVQIEIIPDNAPISIPQGGTFTFGVHLTSEYPPTTQAWVWTEIEFPNGQVFGPIARAHPNIFFGMDVWVTNLSQTMPITSPVGEYRYYINVGLNQVNPLIYDYFRFNVTPAAAGSTGGTEWTSTGLEQLNEITGDVSEALSVPVEFELAQVYPNPFNPTANVSVVLPKATQLTVGVYNVIGQLVSELTTGQFSAGTHNFVLDGSNLSSGVYFVRAMTSEGDAGMQKVMLMK
jgi:Secretion system C-terminal sorting domain